MTGFSDPTLLPSFTPSVPQFGHTFVARLSNDGSIVKNLYIGPNYATALAVALTPAGTFVAQGQNGSLWIENVNAGPSLLGTSNAAAGTVTGLVSASELISLYGIGIGPTTAIPGKVMNGAFTTSLAGYQVLFDGIAAPLLYAGPTQINAIVPIEIYGQESAHIQITSPSGTLDGPTLFLRPAQPEIFLNSQTGLAAALNQDGSVNSPQNPAAPGSIVTVYTTGNGIATGTDGEILSQANPSGSLPTAILTPEGTSLEILYSGAAPGLVSGVSQINFQLPDSLPLVPTYNFQLLVGDAMSQSTFIAVRQ